MTGSLLQLSARLRNLFSIGELVKRDDSGAVQVKTLSGRAVWGKEAFPYGFYAKAKKGRVFVFCQGGNTNGLEILPVQIDQDITPPELEEGDAALFTEDGGCIVLRNSGDVEVCAKGSGKTSISCENGKLYLGNKQKNLCALITGLIDEIKAIVTSGAPPSHTVNPASQQKLEAYKNQIKALLEEAA